MPVCSKLITSNKACAFSESGIGCSEYGGSSGFVMGEELQMPQSTIGGMQDREMYRRIRGLKRRGSWNEWNLSWPNAKYTYI